MQIAMVRKIILVALMAMCVGIAFGAKGLKFNDNGKLKIVQFTDTHLIWDNPKSDRAYENVRSVIEFEHPDFVMFTGDQVYGPGVENSLRKLLGIPAEKGIPFAMVLGNHDKDYEATPVEMYDIAQSVAGSLMPARTDSVFEDFAIEVKGSKSDDVAYVFYCMDTHAKNSVVKGYDWLFPHQIKWYEKKSDAYGRVPALLFMHIPFPEYRDAANNKKALVGNKKEDVCCSAMNSGMFLLIRENGDVKGVFCGHDHNNDFASTYLDMLLAYGRYSGGDTVYNDLGKNGARVILLDEQNPNTIETWIRLCDGSIESSMTYTHP